MKNLSKNAINILLIFLSLILFVILSFNLYKLFNSFIPTIVYFLGIIICLIFISIILFCLYKQNNKIILKIISIIISMFLIVTCSVSLYTVSKISKVFSTSSNDKNILNETVNILLIGYAPNTEDAGFADSMILATVNLKTFDILLTSIPRDIYGEIGCGLNLKDKINYAINFGEDCLVETIENRLDIGIDYYAKINFDGFVDIVDLLGGVYVYNPTEFTGQTSSYIRGTYTVWVPEGYSILNGQQALAFVRERHAFYDNDEIRQRHQQEVIKQLLSKILEVKDINTLIKFLDILSDNVSTDISLMQLINVYDYINAINLYSNKLDLIDIFDINGSLLKGNAVEVYDELMEQNIWVLEPDEFSLNKLKRNIETLKNTNDNIKQDAYFYFNVLYPYYD